MGTLRFVAMVVVTLAMAIPAIAVSAFDHGGRRSSGIVALWARMVLACAGVRVDVEGRENLPPEGAQLYVSSHQSMLDIPALFTVVPARTRFVAKRELFSIPLFGRAIRMLGFVPIDRSDRRAAVPAASDLVSLHDELLATGEDLADSSRLLSVPLPSVADRNDWERWPAK